jgi:hypothetical protein
MVVPLALVVLRDQQSLKGWSFANRGIDVLVPRGAVTRSSERREEDVWKILGSLVDDTVSVIT